MGLFRVLVDISTEVGERNNVIETIDKDLVEIIKMTSFFEKPRFISWIHRAFILG